MSEPRKELVPESESILTVKVPPSVTGELYARAWAASVTRGDVIRHGIDHLTQWIRGVRGTEARDLIEETRPEEDEPLQGLTIRLQPERQMMIQESMEAVNTHEVKKEGGVTITDLLRAAVYWGVGRLGPSDIRPADPLKGNDRSHFSKPSDAKRSGRPVRMAITREASTRLKEKGATLGIRATHLARRGIRKMLDWIEKEPSTAWRYIQEDSDLYQNSDEKYPYHFQLYVSLETKRRLKAAKTNLNSGPAEDGPRATQKGILRAAGRWAIEEIQLDKKSFLGF